MEDTRPIVTVGSFDIYLLKQDWFALDAGVLFGNVPKSVWAGLPGFRWIKKHNLVPLPINVFLLRGAGENIVVDTGIGSPLRFSKRAREQFRMRESESMDRALLRHGLTREDIHVLLHTHLHFDHAGGDVMKDEADVLVPTFPNARHYAAEREIHDALTASRHPFTRSSYRRETIEGIAVLQERGLLRPVGRCGQFILNWDRQLPGNTKIFLLPTPGHTEGHYSVLIQEERNSVPQMAACITGAVLTTRWHARDAFSLGNDTVPKRGIETKLEILSRAYRMNWLLLLEHDEMVAGRLQKSDDQTFFLQETPRL